MTTRYQWGLILVCSGCMTRINPAWDDGEGADVGGSATDGVSTDGDDGGTGPGNTTASGPDGDTSNSGAGPCDPATGDCFADVTQIPLDGDDPRAVWAGDLDGDGAADVVVAFAGSHEVQLLRGNGTGSFDADPAVLIDGPKPRPWDLMVVDLDGSGPSEVLTANRDGGDVAVLQLDGELQLRGRYETGSASESLAAGQFDDGPIDVVVASRDLGQVVITTGEGGMELSSPNFFDIGDKPSATAVGDFDEDGQDDVVTANAGGGLSVRLGDGSGGFEDEPVVLLEELRLVDVVAVDLDEDGHVDVATLEEEDDRLHLLWSAGGQMFPEVAPISTSRAKGAGPTRLAAADVDGDTWADLVVSNYDGETVAVLLARDNRRFESPVELDAPGRPWAVASADFNGDGRRDVVATLPDDDALAVFLSNP